MNNQCAVQLEKPLLRERAGRVQDERYLSLFSFETEHKANEFICPLKIDTNETFSFEKQRERFLKFIYHLTTNVNDSFIFGEERQMNHLSLFHKDKLLSFEPETTIK